MACNMQKGTLGQLCKVVWDHPAQSSQGDPRQHFTIALDFELR